MNLMCSSSDYMWQKITIVTDPTFILYSLHILAPSSLLTLSLIFPNPPIQVL